MVGKEKKGGVKLSNSNFFKFNQNPTNITDSQYHTKFQDLLKYLKENITENKKKGRFFCHQERIHESVQSSSVFTT